MGYTGPNCLYANSGPEALTAGSKSVFLSHLEGVMRPREAARSFLDLQKNNHFQLFGKNQQ